MRIITFLLLSVVFASSCGQTDSSTEKDITESSTNAMDTANYTTIQWMDSVQHIGIINHGENREISFRFKNTGEHPLLVISVNPGCGCTVADYPKQAILPGEEGVIKAGFETQNQAIGAFQKSISVTTNTPGKPNHVLVFTGEILTAEGKPANAGNKQPRQPSNAVVTEFN